MPRTKQPRPPSTFIDTWSQLIRNLPFQVVDPKGDSELPSPSPTSPQAESVTPAPGPRAPEQRP